MANDALPSSPPRVIQEVASFQWDGNGPEPGIGLALSGGGFRAMLFHAGALQRLNELGLLPKISRVSSVSGGSIAAGFLARVWRQLGVPNASGVFPNFRTAYLQPLYAFARSTIDVGAVLTGLLPGVSAAEQVAEQYDTSLFNKISLQDIPDTPRFVFCATNLQTGVLWRFSKPYAGDYLVGRIDKPSIALSHAVAASSAFPPILSPMVVKLPTGTFVDWPTGPSKLRAEDLAAYRANVILSDGGVYDNHGLKPIVKRYYTLLVSDGGAPFDPAPNVATDWLGQLRRILDVTDNQVRALRRRDLISRLDAGNAVQSELDLAQKHSDGRMGAYWGIDTDARKVDPPGAIACDLSVVKALAAVSTRLADAGEATSKQLVNWGYAIADRSIRTNWRGPFATVPTKLPFPETPLAR
jgi:NTE family protein